MTAASHALIGTMVAARVADPALAIGISFGSHFIADFIPHWDSGTHWREKTRRRLKFEAMVDVLLGFILSYLLYTFLLRNSPSFAGENYALVFFCILAAQAPDWVTAPRLMFGADIPGSEFVYQIQHKLNTKLDKPWGIVTQVVVLLVLYLVLF